jgi:hypothetical protein
LADENNTLSIAEVIAQVGLTTRQYYYRKRTLATIAETEEIIPNTHTHDTEADESIITVIPNSQEILSKITGVDKYPIAAKVSKLVYMPYKYYFILSIYIYIL